MRRNMVPDSVPSPVFVTGGVKHQQLFWANLTGAFGFAVILTILARWVSGLPGWADVILAENGPVERMSAGIWFMSMVWCLAAGLRPSVCRVEWLGLSVLCLLLGLRELDAHIWATGWNLDKLANYVNPLFPLWERLLVVGCLVLPVSVTGVIVGGRVWRRWNNEHNQEPAWVGQLIAGLIFLGVCVILDKGNDTVLQLLELEGATLVLMGLEEFSEFVLSLYLVSVLWPYWQAALFVRNLND